MYWRYDVPGGATGERHSERRQGAALPLRKGANAVRDPRQASALNWSQRTERRFQPRPIDYQRGARFKAVQSFSMFTQRSFTAHSNVVHDELSRRDDVSALRHARGLSHEFVEPAPPEGSVHD